MQINSPFDELHPQSYRISNVKLCNDISVIEVGHNKVPNGLRQIMQRDVYILHYITKGKGVFLDTKFDKTNGYIVVPGELEIIEADKDNPYEAYWIMFKGPASSDILKKCGFPAHNSVFEFDKNQQCADIIKNALFEMSPKNELEESCIMQSAFYQIIALHLQTAKIEESASIAQRVMEFITDNYHKQISISELAQKNNYTRTYLYRLFKNEYNMSPQEYLITLRIEKAKQLLKDRRENLSVNDVATMTGFNDPLYFSRMFRKKTGLSPTKYRTET